MENVSIVVISTCVSIIAAVWAINRDSKQDTKQDTESNVTVREEIKYISRGVEDIKYDTRSLTATITGLNERLIRVEESAKSAHEKIDSLKNTEAV